MPIHHHSERGAKAVAVPLVNLKGGLDFNEIFGTKEGGTPLTAGKFVVTAGEAVTFVYPGDEFVYVIKGELTLDDVSAGTSAQLHEGDVVHITKGTKVRWSSTGVGEGFWVSQKEIGKSLEDHIV